MDAVLDAVLDFITHHRLLVATAVVVVLIFYYRWILWLFGVVIVPDDPCVSVPVMLSVYTGEAP